MAMEYTPIDERGTQRINIDDCAVTTLRPAKRHLDNAVTSLCLGLQCSEDREEASRIISALTVTVAARFGAGEKR